MDKKAQVTIIKDHALRELEIEVRYFCDNYSIEYADKFRLAFFDKITDLHHQPYIYPECRFLVTKSQMYRNIVWGNYLIIYKIKRGAEAVEVLSLFHTKQQPSKIKLVRKVK